MPDLTTRTGWRELSAPLQPQSGSLAVVYSLWLAVVLIYWPSCLALEGYWTDTVDHTYTHGYLILFVSLWLVYRDRARLAATPVRPIPAAWAAVAVLSAAWLWFWRAAIQDPQLLLLPLLLVVAIVAGLGFRVARVVLFPVGFLYFAMPVWSDINGILQALSVHVNGLLIWVAGIPGYMQGDLVQLPSGTLEIAEGCSGLHFFIVGLTLATLYGEVSREPLRRRILWIGLMGMLALIANWLRIFVIVAAAYFTEMHTSLVAQHYWFGWGVFVAFFVGFLWLAGRLSTAWDRGGSPEEGPQSAPPAASGVGLRRMMVTFACLGVLPGLAYGSQLLWPESRAAVAIEWPSAPPGWQGPQDDPTSEWTPEFVGASAESLRRYVDAQGRATEMLVAAYRNQTQDGKLLGYYNSVVGSSHRLRVLSESIVSSPTGSWRQTTAVDTLGMRSLIWARYRIGERRFVRPLLSQLWYGIAALTSRPVSSVIALRAVCVPDCRSARAQLAAAAGLQPAMRGRGDSAP